MVTEVEVQAMEVVDIVRDIGPLSVGMTPKGFAAAIKKVWLEGTQEDARKFLENHFDYLKQACNESPKNEVDVCKGYSSEEVQDAVNEAAEEVARVWKEKNANKRKEVRKG